MHDDYQNEQIRQQVAVRYEQMLTALRQAAKMQRTLTTFGVNLLDKKMVGIKALREETGLGLKEAKDAWELAYELRAAA